MIGFSKLAYNALRDEDKDRIVGNPIDWWKKSKPATIWMLLCMVCEIPLVIIKKLIMAICFIPYVIYYKLDN